MAIPKKPTISIHEDPNVEIVRPDIKDAEKRIPHVQATVTDKTLIKSVATKWLVEKARDNNMLVPNLPTTSAKGCLLQSFKTALYYATGEKIDDLGEALTSYLFTEGIEEILRPGLEDEKVSLADVITRSFSFNLEAGEMRVILMTLAYSLHVRVVLYSEANTLIYKSSLGFRATVYLGWLVNHGNQSIHMVPVLPRPAEYLASPRPAEGVASPRLADEVASPSADISADLDADFAFAMQLNESLLKEDAAKREVEAADISDHAGEYAWKMWSLDGKAGPRPDKFPAIAMCTPKDLKAARARADAMFRTGKIFDTRKGRQEYEKAGACGQACLPQYRNFRLTENAGGGRCLLLSLYAVLEYAGLIPANIKNAEDLKHQVLDTFTDPAARSALALYEGIGEEGIRKWMLKVQNNSCTVERNMVYAVICKLYNVAIYNVDNNKYFHAVYYNVHQKAQTSVAIFHTSSGDTGHFQALLPEYDPPGQEPLKHQVGISIPPTPTTTSTPRNPPRFSNRFRSQQGENSRSSRLVSAGWGFLKDIKARIGSDSSSESSESSRNSPNNRDSRNSPNNRDSRSSLNSQDNSDLLRSQKEENTRSNRHKGVHTGFGFVKDIKARIGSDSSSGNSRNLQDSRSSLNSLDNSDLFSTDWGSIEVPSTNTNQDNNEAADNSFFGDIMAQYDKIISRGRSKRVYKDNADNRDNRSNRDNRDNKDNKDNNDDSESYNTKL